MTGNIIQILPRKNELIRPASANIDQAMVIFAVKSPEPNYNLLDRFIMMMDYQNVPTVVVFNKIDLAEDDTLEELSDIYEKCGCKVIFISTYDNKGIDIVLKTLEKKTTILAGPSGVGKSSLTNLILPQEVSATRDATYICDTPGFTSLNIPELEKEQIRFYFEEFSEYEGQCRFNGCVHINEPDCRVKEAVEAGLISRRRYTSYVEIYDEVKNKKKY